MANDGEDAYRNADIQGDVLPGFRSRKHTTFHQRFLLMQITGAVDEARKGLSRLLENGIISTGRDVARSGTADRTPTYVNVAFTAHGLERLGRPSSDTALTEGLAVRSTTQVLLGDPTHWRVGAPDQVIDAVFNIGSTEEQLVNAMATSVLDMLGPAYTETTHFDGALLPEGREHFGFRDGLAKPFVSDGPAGACPAHGSGGKPRVVGTAVWPNWKALALQATAEQASVRADEAEKELKAAIEASENATEEAAASAGYRLCTARHAADQAAAAARNARRAADAETANKVEERSPGVPIRPIEQFVVRDGDEFTKNGSYMVWLQLEQRPAEFWAMCRDVAAAVQPVFKGADEDFAAALLVGRHLDGAALEPHPPRRPEDFSFFADPLGEICPAGAHIRLTNPRDLQTAGAMILRRGIAYGPPAATRDTNDGQERGLIFVCYQADIVNQYEQLQGQLANAQYKDGQPAGRFPDVLISQQGRDGSVVEIGDPQGGSIGTRLNNNWVVPHGGLYLFVPSIAGLRILCDPDGEAAHSGRQ